MSDYQRLASMKEDLESATGIPLSPHSKGRFLIRRHTADTHNMDNWDQLCDLLHETSDEYEAILRSVFEEES